MTIDAKGESSWRLSETRGGHGAGLSARRSSVAPIAFPRRRTPLPAQQFLIANARLEFRVSHSKQSPGPSSNRERIAIFQRDFSAPDSLAASLRPCLPASALAEIPLATEFLIGTFANSKFESTPCKHNTKQNSNRYKTALPRGGPLWRTAISDFSVRSRLGLSLPASSPVPVAATRRARYNSGSHTEVNQP